MEWELVPIDEYGRLFLSPDIHSWEPLKEQGISAVIDLDGGLDIDVPTVPNHILYIYFPIYDNELPDLERLHAIARLGASLVSQGHRVLSHCGMGLNRSALVAGLILTYLGLTGPEAIELLRERRPGALFNETFAAYLETVNAANLT